MLAVPQPLAHAVDVLAGGAAYHLYSTYKSDSTHRADRTGTPYDLTVITSHPGPLASVLPGEAKLKVIHRGDDLGAIGPRPVVGESSLPPEGIDGKVVVITGAGSGIGRALALRSAAGGALLALSDWDADGLAETVRLVEQAGGTTQIPKVRHDVVDVSDRAAVAAWADGVVEEFGRVNLVVNNAGVTATGDFTDTREMPWYVTTLLISQPLHFGDYGGMPLKILWAILDVITIVVLVTGLYLWFRRRRPNAANRFADDAEIPPRYAGAPAE